MEEEKGKQIIGKLSKDYIWKAKAATRESKKGRAKGGLLVGIRNEKGEHVAVEEWDYGLTIKGLVTEQGKCNIVGIYNNEGINKIENSLKKVCEELVNYR